MKAIWPPKTPEGLAFTPAYAMEPETQLVFLRCITPLRKGRLDESIEGQAKACLANLEDTLREFGPDARAVKSTRLMTDVREVWDTQRAHEEAFGQWQPTSTLLEVPVCSTEGARIEFDFWAMVPPASGSAVKRSIAGEGGIPRAVCVGGKVGCTRLLHIPSTRRLSGCSASLPRASIRLSGGWRRWAEVSATSSS